MRVLVEVDDEKVLQGLNVLGKEKDFLLNNLFSRSDFEDSLNAQLDCEYNDMKELKFVEHLRSDSKSYNKIIDSAMAGVSRHFDANLGVNWDVISDEIMTAYSEAFNKFYSKDISR